MEKKTVTETGKTVTPSRRKSAAPKAQGVKRKATPRKTVTQKKPEPKIELSVELIQLLNDNKDIIQKLVENFGQQPFQTPNDGEMKSFPLKIPKSLHLDVKTFCSANDMNMNDFVFTAILEKVSQYKESIEKYKVIRQEK
jgi:NRPS condensation-like uncharacterized protein